MPTDKDTVLAAIEESLLERSDIMGCAIIAEGIHINFKGSSLWWRIEVSDITEALKRAFGR